MKIGFVSFAGGDLLWRNSLRRIRSQALKSGLFEEVSTYTPKDLERITNPADLIFIKTNSRGFGYWLWKPLIVLDFLSSNPDIDSILYADAGCDLNINPGSIDNWKRYLNILSTSEGIFFRMELIERSWTKQEVFDAFPEWEKHRDSEQLLGGVFFMNREFALNFCTKWLEIMRQDSYSLLNDNFDKSIQDPAFRQPRHDQSILSLLAKNQKEVLILDSLQEMYFEPNWTLGLNHPIWTSRTKSIVPKYKSGLPAQIIGLLERLYRRIFL